MRRSGRWKGVGTVKSEKRSGSIALSLLIALTALLTASLAALAVMSRSYGSAAVYGKGLSAVYAAESGANWGLAYLKGGGKEPRSISFDEAGIRVEASVDVEKGWIRSSAADSSGRFRRCLTLTFTRTEKDGQPVVTVEDVSTDAF